MKIKDLTLKNILSFIQGNYSYYYDKIIGLPPYKKEQILYRLELCKNDCVKEGRCKYCSCPTQKKVFASQSCNNNKRFPNLMDEVNWIKFKEKNNL